MHCCLQSTVWQGVPHIPGSAGCPMLDGLHQQTETSMGWRRQTWRDQAELAGPQKVASARRRPVISRLWQAGASRKRRKKERGDLFLSLRREGQSHKSAIQHLKEEGPRTLSARRIPFDKDIQAGVFFPLHELWSIATGMLWLRSVWLMIPGETHTRVNQAANFQPKTSSAAAMGQYWCFQLLKLTHTFCRYENKGLKCGPTCVPLG